MSCDAWTTVEGPLPACMHAVWYLGSILLPRGLDRDATRVDHNTGHNRGSAPLPACMHAVLQSILSLVSGVPDVREGPDAR